jgi:hypothetical protein
VINLQYNDRDVVRLSQDLDLTISPRLMLFTRQRVISSDYRNVEGFTDRDSVKYDSVNGIEVGLTPLTRGRFEFHFAEEHFRDATINATPEVGYKGALTWLPRRNVRITTAVGRDFGGVNFDLDAAGGRRTRVDSSIDYELTRRVFARGTFAYQHSNEASLATGGKRIEDVYQYKASLAYEPTRFWMLFLDYLYERREAKIEENQFDRHIIQGGVVARF